MSPVRRRAQRIVHNTQRQVNSSADRHADQSSQVRRLRQLHLRLPDGRDLHRPGAEARHHRPRRVRRVLHLLQRPQPGAPEPDGRAHGAEGLCRHAHPLRAGAGRLSDRRLRAGRADVAARGPPRVLGSARAARVHGRRGTRHRRSEDQRRHRPRRSRRGRLHDRTRTSRRWRPLPRHPGSMPRAGGCRRRLREEESGHLAHERRRHRHHPRGHPRREGALGDRRDQGAGRARRGNHPAGVGRREAHRHGGDDRRRRPLRRAGRRHGGRSDPRAARLQPRPREDQHRPRPPRRCRRQPPSARW